MKVLRKIFPIIVVALSSYALITDTTEMLIPYILLSMGLMLLVTGINEFQKRKVTAFALFLAFGFSLFVAIKFFL
ncbi:DUF3953 domain-containing protein [Filibacter tadaridae]|uniref:DUF3953 domain-containing protein n=1 Tax=Filibacter tadaridae TaxID=2483811 RepID=A0A3P5XBQ8_9BACL|nr:DUF3953 domain-containing protein [Filibacter tadaridae]VDC32100.1 hypothetical protein FILTAD_02587 [Filibacter tadaridae]